MCHRKKRKIKEAGKWIGLCLAGVSVCVYRIVCVCLFENRHTKQRFRLAYACVHIVLYMCVNARCKLQAAVHE